MAFKLSSIEHGFHKGDIRVLCCYSPDSSSSSAPTWTKAYLFYILYILDFCVGFYLEKKRSFSCFKKEVKNSDLIWVYLCHVYKIYSLSSQIHTLVNSKPRPSLLKLLSPLNCTLSLSVWIWRPKYIIISARINILSTIP